jgi:hypothetical protein
MHKEAKPVLGGVSGIRQRGLLGQERQQELQQKNFPKEESPWEFALIASVIVIVFLFMMWGVLTPQKMVH